MKWIMLSMSIWQDGAYTFMPANDGKTYKTEAECILDIHTQRGFALNDLPATFTGYICVPPDTWNNFQVRWRLQR